MELCGETVPWSREKKWAQRGKGKEMVSQNMQDWQELGLADGINWDLTGRVWDDAKCLAVMMRRKLHSRTGSDHYWLERRTILASCLQSHLNFLKSLFILKILHLLGLRTFFLGVLYIPTLSTAFIIISLFEDILFMNILMLNSVGHFSSEIFLIWGKLK